MNLEETLKPSSIVGTSSTSYTSAAEEGNISHPDTVTTGLLPQLWHKLCHSFGKDREEFPPPPPDMLQPPVDVTAFSQSELPNLPRIPPVPKRVYSKQRNLYELNRLYKHIHPELRKNLEKDYISEVSDCFSSNECGELSFSRCATSPVCF